MSLGGIEAVRRYHPTAEITLLTTPFLKDFANACPFIDFVQTNGRPKGFTGNYRLLHGIEGGRPYIFVENLEAQLQRKSGGLGSIDTSGKLMLRLDLVGFMRPEAG